MRCPGCGRYTAAADLAPAADGGVVCGKCRAAVAPQEYPHKIAGWILLGPDVVATPDLARVRVRGIWYHRMDSHAPHGRGAAEPEDRPAPEDAGLF